MAQPKLKKLYIIRHGQTDYNKNGMVQGQGIDAPLNQLGREQAAHFYRAFAKKKFDKIYVSNLQRTYQSVESFINDGLPYERLAGLNEISWGSQEGKKFDENTSQLYYETIDRWNEGDLEATVGGGESPLEVEYRQRMAIETIMSKSDEQEVLICMHGRAMRILLCWLTGKSLSKMDEFPHDNLGLYEVHEVGGAYQIAQANITAHMSA